MAVFSNENGTRDLSASQQPEKCSRVHPGGLQKVPIQFWNVFTSRVLLSELGRGARRDDSEIIEGQQWQDPGGELQNHRASEA